MLINLSLSKPPLWKQQLRKNFVDLTKLADFLELTYPQRQALTNNSRFALNLPYRLAAKMRKGDLNDPLFKQFVPLLSEQIKSPNFVNDPVGDSACRSAKKYLKKYHGRALLLCTSACAMHCRYCFRQHFDYEVADKSFENELQLIQEDSSLNEIILSGGDPLSLDNKVLRSLLERLSAIPQIKKVRFHSRFPIGIPERIDQEFIELLQAFSFQYWFVIHVNHPQELDEDIFTALNRLQKMGIPILNQSVLLRDINDNPQVLAELCLKLVDHGIIPYYLHQLDRVQGASHFEVSEEQGKEIIAQLATMLPGYAVPKYVKEVAGAESKTLI